MQLVLITSPHHVAGEAELCNNMAAIGLRRLHLRKPNWRRADAAAFLGKLEPATLQTIVLHSWHDLVSEFAVKVAGSTAGCMAVLVVRAHRHARVVGHPLHRKDKA